MLARLARAGARNATLVASGCGRGPLSSCSRRELISLPSIDLEQSFSATKRVPYTPAQVRLADGMPWTCRPHTAAPPLDPVFARHSSGCGQAAPRSLQSPAAEPLRNPLLSPLPASLRRTLTARISPVSPSSLTSSPTSTNTPSSSPSARAPPLAPPSSPPPALRRHRLAAARAHKPTPTSQALGGAPALVAGGV